MDLDRYQKLKKRVDKLQHEKSRADGALAQTMDRLKKEHGCKSLSEASAKLKKMTKEQEKAEREFDSAVGQFDEEWGGILDEVSQ